jgi:hypothetical protein
LSSTTNLKRRSRSEHCVGKHAEQVRVSVFEQPA